MSIPLPQPPETPNVRALASWSCPERYTGLSGASVTVRNKVVAGTAMVWKNGSLVDPSTVTTSANVITLGSTLVVGDVVVVTYYFRNN